MTDQLATLQQAAAARMEMVRASRGLSTPELLRATLSVAVARAQEAGLDRDALHTALDEVILGQAPGLSGAIDALPAVRAANRERQS